MDQTNFNIIRYKNIFLIISGSLLVLSVIAILAFSFNLGVDFKGGTLWQFRVNSTASSTASGLTDVQNFFVTDLKLPDALVSQEAKQGEFLVRLPVVQEADHINYISKLTQKFPDFTELSFQSIGPSVGAELKRRALWGILLVLLGISVYIAFAFRKVSRPVASWKYGVITLVTLFHDVLIPAGFLAILGRYHGVELDSNFVVALLVIMGFSVHDTIVVFDRIRENLSLDRGKSNFSDIINGSINQTLGRSINTSLTLILVLLALYFVGPMNLGYFVLTLLVGVTLGTYSSIFVASPALLWVSPKSLKNKR